MESRDQRATFLVEHYRPDVGVEELRRCVLSLRASVRDLERHGKPVRFLCSVVVPDDESFLVLIEAASPQIVQEACARASIASDRISIAIAETADPLTTHPVNTSNSAPTEPERNTRC